MKPLPRLYAIADAAFGDPVSLCRDLFDGGARWVQIRDKRAAARSLLSQVEEILRFAPRDAVVIVNDRVDVALLARASGVHLGQTDLPVANAREILGTEPVIGLSTHSLEQAMTADCEAVDYIAVGPIYPTASKENPDPVVGLEGLSEICRTVHKPVVAIGGITLERAPDVLKAGAVCVAVISALLRTDDIAARTRLWLDSL